MGVLSERKGLARGRLPQGALHANSLRNHNWQTDVASLWVGFDWWSARCKKALERLSERHLPAKAFKRRGTRGTRRRTN
jgi:hypothetical protein